MSGKSSHSWSEVFLRAQWRRMCPILLGIDAPGWSGTQGEGAVGEVVGLGREEEGDCELSLSLFPFET